MPVFNDNRGYFKKTFQSDAFHEFGMIGGEKKANELMKYHKINGGISRFVKMPLYLSWAGETPKPAKVQEPRTKS